MLLRFSVQQLREAIALLVTTARSIASKRMASGALQLSSQEIRVAFDESKRNVTELQEQVHLHDVRKLHASSL
jgi:exoribonuclease R